MTDKAIKACFLLAFAVIATLAMVMAADGQRVVIIKNAAGEWERVR